MSRATNVAFPVAGAFLAGGVLAFAPISGELEPPGGAISDTTPSLAELSQQIEALASVQQEAWSSRVFVGQDVSANALGEGPVLLHKIIGSGGTLVILEGPGNIDPTTGFPTPGTESPAVATLQGLSSSGSNSAVYNIVIDDPHIASRATADALFTVLYRSVP